MKFVNSDGSESSAKPVDMMSDDELSHLMQWGNPERPVYKQAQVEIKKRKDAKAARIYSM